MGSPYSISHGLTKENVYLSLEHPTHGRCDSSCQAVLLAAAQRATERLLHISLLGPPQFTVRGMSLPPPRQQLRALLYRLAVALQPVSRERFLLTAA